MVFASPKQVLHLNTNNSFISFCAFLFKLTRTDLEDDYLFMKMIYMEDIICNAFWLYCYNPGCSCFVLFFERWQVSEWWWKQQHEWELLCADIFSSFSSLSCLWNTLCWSACRNVAVKASSRLKKHDMNTEKIIPERSEAYFICAWYSTHMLFLASKSDECPSGTWNLVIQQVGRVVTHNNS